METGFGLKIEIPEFHQFFNTSTIKEAGFAVTHPLNYIPPARWNHHPDGHRLRTTFEHSFKHGLTTAQTKLSVFGGNAKLSANSKGEFSWCELGFNWGWDHSKTNIFGVRSTIVEARVVNGEVLPRLDKQRVISGKKQWWQRGSSLQTKVALTGAPGIEVITSQEYTKIIEVNGIKKKFSVLIWNGTVANLTLSALRLPARTVEAPPRARPFPTCGW